VQSLELNLATCDRKIRLARGGLYQSMRTAVVVGGWMMLVYARSPCNCPWSVPIIRETLWRESHNNRPARTDRHPERRGFDLGDSPWNSNLGMLLQRSWSWANGGALSSPIEDPRSVRIPSHTRHRCWAGSWQVGWWREHGGWKEWKEMKGRDRKQERRAPTPRSQYRGRVGKVQVGRKKLEDWHPRRGRNTGAEWGRCRSVGKARRGLQEGHRLAEGAGVGESQRCHP
jgi:hypothetical protein